jgi:hypothetical protein
MATPYPYIRHNVPQLKEMMRATGLRSDFPPRKPGMVAYLEKWDREHPPLIAANLKPPEKLNTGVRANWSISKQASSQPAPVLTLGAPSQTQKRKQPTPAPATTTRAKRQKTADKDVETGTSKSEAPEAEDAGVDNDEDEETVDAADKEPSPRPKKLKIRVPSLRKQPPQKRPGLIIHLPREPVLPDVPEDVGEIVEPQPAKLLDAVHAIPSSSQAGTSLINHDETQSAQSKQGEVQKSLSRHGIEKADGARQTILEDSSITMSPSPDQIQSVKATPSVTSAESTQTNTNQTDTTTLVEGEVDLMDDEDEQEVPRTPRHFGQSPISSKHSEGSEDEEDEPEISQQSGRSMGAPKLKNEDYPNASPGLYVDKEVAKAFPAIHHVYQEVYSESEDEEKRIPIESLGYDEYLKRERKIRRRNGEPSPEKFMGGPIFYNEGLEEKAANLKAVRKRRKEKARLEAEARANANSLAEKDAAADMEVTPEGDE